MPRIGQMFPSRFLKASDFEDGDATLIISDIREEAVGQGRDSEDKWILYFEGTEKGLVLNKTNSTILAKLYGDDTDGWIGQSITLYATEVQFKDDMVEAIRVRSKAPKGRGGPAAGTGAVPPGKPYGKPPKAKAEPVPAPADDDDDDDDEGGDIPF